ncbi:transposase [Thermoanaerobacterium thermosaccharolyticum]|uniref:transposase n=1 Tax=Thermoanaerobacterium thermosaccharolyticum TaxID=1517 RepID=UPI003DA90A8A
MQNIVKLMNRLMHFRYNCGFNVRYSEPSISTFSRFLNLISEFEIFKEDFKQLIKALI